MAYKHVLGVLLFSTITLAGCETTGMPWKSSSAKEDKPAVKAEQGKKVQPDKKAELSGANCNKPVTDSSKVEAGEGCKVKGLNDWEGEISGVAAAGSKFSKLKIGMPMRQVTDLVGSPTDEGAYVTGKAWIPFYFGSDRHRYEMVFKNMGRLIFAGGGMGDYSSGHLIWVIHNAKEQGYR